MKFFDKNRVTAIYASAVLLVASMLMVFGTSLPASAGATYEDRYWSDPVETTLIATPGPYDPIPCSLIQKKKSTYFEPGWGAGTHTDWQLKFSVIVQYYDCVNSHPIKKVINRYDISGADAEWHCEYHGSAFTQFKTVDADPQTDDLAGWDIPTTSWPCSNGTLTGVKSFDAPNLTAVNGSNDNTVDIGLTMVVSGWTNPNIQAPTVTVPRP